MLSYFFIKAMGEWVCGSKFASLYKLTSLNYYNNNSNNAITIICNNDDDTQIIENILNSQKLSHGIIWVSQWLVGNIEKRGLTDLHKIARWSLRERDAQAYLVF